MTEPKKYNCEKCKYSTNVKYNYQQHLLSKAHNGAEKCPYKRNEAGLFECKSCKFMSPSSSNYRAHLKTDKHLELGVDDRNVRYGLDHLTKSLEMTKVRDYFLRYCKHPNFENATDSDSELEDWRKTIKALKDQWLTEKTMKAKDVLILSQTVRKFIDKFDKYYDIQPASCEPETPPKKRPKIRQVVTI